MKFLRLALFALLLAACTAQPISGAISTQEPPNPAEVKDPENQTEWNFLVLGSDYRANDPNRQLPHTDSFLIVHVEEWLNAGHEGTSAPSLMVTFMPIARELWFGDHGIANSVYRREGFDGVHAVVQEYFGLVLDGIFYADMDNFEAFVNDIGGVKLTPAETVIDRCGDKQYNLPAGKTEVFSGFDLLCYARMRKGADDGYFSRQTRHAEILIAIWNQLKGQVGTDPVTVADAAANHPFVEAWPFVAWPRLGLLAVRSAWVGTTEYKTVSLDSRFLQSGQEYGPMADGSFGPFNVQYPLVDLKQWAECATDWSCAAQYE